jgi:hypothetical protein
MRSVFRPAFGRGMSIAFGALGVVALFLVVLNDGTRGLLRTGPWLALVVGTVWAMYWRPEVAVDDSGVRVVNVLHTVHLPWPSIQRIDTKWALTLFTAYGKVTAWAAPAPGGFASRMAGRNDFRGLPESTFGGDRSIRPGDLPGTPSGAAALVVRRRWEELRDAGHLDDPKLEFSRPPTMWHYRTILVGALLVLVGLLASLFA